MRTDGLLHVETSALLFMLFAKLSVMVAVLICLVLGIMKELYDKYSGKGLAEWHDIWCDLIGIAAGIIIWYIPVLG